MKLQKASVVAESGGMDAQLQHAAARDARGGLQRAALALHLSQLVPPAPRPHHRRIARAMLDDAAQAHAGQVFTRPNGDLVLLGGLEGAAGARDTLAQVFRVDTPRIDQLLSLWALPHDSIGFETYLARAVEGHPAREDPRAAQGAVTAMQALAGATRLTDLIRRQTGVRMAPGGFSPIYRELSFSLAALDARASAAGSAQADAYLFRHLAGELDRRMMDLLAHELARAGGMPPGPPLHVNLTLGAILSPAFPRLAAAAAAASTVLGVEVALMDAVADPMAFGAARMALRAHGCALVLDMIGHPALLLARPEALEPDLVKLDWAPAMATLAPRDQRLLAESVGRIGAGRLVLHRVETEAALAWAAALGVTRFQGRHIDAMLAATRLARCPHASFCTLRQCSDRAAATGAAGRAGCRDTARLDSAEPSPAGAMA